MRTEKWVNSVKYTRVMRDVSDGSKDYWVTQDELKKLIEEKKIFYELTNHCYCHEDKNS